MSKYSNMDKNWYEKCEDKEFLKYVLYSDSVSKQSTTIIKYNKRIEEIQFDCLWNRLIKTNDVSYVNDKEYIFFKENIKFMNYNVKKDKIIFTKAKYLMRHKINKNILRLRFTNNAYLDVTKNHSLLDYDYKRNSLIKTKPKNSPYISIMRNQDINFNIDYNYLLYGLWIGDGTYSSCYPGISSNEREEIIQFLNNNLNNIKFYISNYNKYDFSINYKPLKIFLENNDLQREKSPNRKISDELFINLCQNNDNFFSLFIGYWIADGNYTSGQVNISSSNKTLLEQIKSLLILRGIYSHIKIDKNGRKYNGEIKGDRYILSLVGIPEVLFNKISSFNYLKNNNKQLILKSNYYGHGRSSINKQIVRKKETAKIFNIKPMKILDKKEFKYSDYVYDVEIPETHNFVANGCLVSNTDSIMLHLIENTEDIKEMIKLAHEHSEKINDLIIDYNVNHLMPKLGYGGNHNNTNFKEELIMEAIMFLDVKKVYAYKLLAKEAHLDENNKLIKGSILEVPKIIPTSNLGVKTDMSSMTKEILHSLLEIALDKSIPIKDKLEKATIVINKVHEKFIKFGEDFDLKEITTPVKWGKQQQVIFGMKLYNAIFENAFEYLSAGRIIYCKIKSLSALSTLNLDIDVDKITALCIPYNYNKDVLKKGLKQYGIEIDFDKQWEQKIMTTTIYRIIELFKLMEKKYELKTG